MKRAMFKILEVPIYLGTFAFSLLVHKFSHAINSAKTKAFMKKTAKYHENVNIYFPIHAEPLGNLTIEEGVSIAPFVQIWAHASVYIGKNTMIASHCVISSSTHDYNESMMNVKRIDKPVYIGENVWFGSGAIVMPGITIGNGAVIGAGAVVTKDVENNAIIVGNPARVMKMREFR